MFSYKNLGSAGILFLVTGHGSLVTGHWYHAADYIVRAYNSRKVLLGTVSLSHLVT